MPDADLPALLEQWSKTTSEATPGPWHNSPDTAAGRVWVQIGPIRSAYSAETDLEPLFNYRIHREAVSEDERRQQFRQRAADAGFIVTSRTAMPRLLGALGDVLKLHQPKPLYGLAFGGLNNDQPLCSHDPDTDHDAHFEGDDGHWYCRDKITAQVCRSCADEDDADLWAEWPCPTVQAITRELTGTETRGA